jgi:hypothetical protein
MNGPADAQGSAAGGYDKNSPVEELAHTQRLLKRVRTVAHRITERVRRVTEDTDLNVPLLKDTSPDIPPLPPDGTQ